MYDDLLNENVINTNYKLANDNWIVFINISIYTRKQKKW